MELTTLGVLAVCLIVSFLMKEIFRRIGAPVVIGQIAAGILIGLPAIRIVLFTPKPLEMVTFLSDLGVLFLLFLAGLEINIEKMLKVLRDAFLIASSSAALSFVMGFALLYFFYGSALAGMGFDPVVASTVFGIVLAITGVGIKTKDLIDIDALDTKLGATMLGAGTIDSMVEIIGFSVILLLAHSADVQRLLFFPAHLVIFAVLCFISFRLFSRALRYIERKETDIDFYVIVISLIFVLTGLSAFLEIGYLIGAIVAGFLLQLSIRRIKRKSRKEKIEEEEVKEALELMTLAFLAPFFFITVGMSLDWSGLFVNPVLLVFTMLVAFSSKILGTMLVKPLTKLSWKQLYLVGWAMNSRGAVVFIIALTALQFGLIPLDVFSVLVATSLVTTITFPIILQRCLKADPGIMNR